VQHESRTDEDVFVLTGLLGYHPSRWRGNIFWRELPRRYVYYKLLLLWRMFIWCHYTVPQNRLRPHGHTRNILAKSLASLCTARALSTTMSRPTRVYRRRRTFDSMHCPRNSCHSVTKTVTLLSSTRSNTSRLLIAAVDTLSCSTVIWIQSRCTVKHHTKSCLVIIFVHFLYYVYKVLLDVSTAQTVIICIILTFVFIIIRKKLYP